MFFELNFWNFLLMVVQIRDLFIRAMRDPGPGVRIVFVHRHNSDLNSVLTVQALGCNFQYGSNVGVSSDPTFWFGCFFVSWQCVLTTGHSICVLREFLSVFRHVLQS